jgi:hypothetical protein
MLAAHIHISKEIEANYCCCLAIDHLSNGIINMVLALVFEQQNISLVTGQRLQSALTSFGFWPRNFCSVTKEILILFEN